jgi:dTDP-4-amino-4,6-dideoxygalactose transaminase
MPAVRVPFTRSAMMGREQEYLQQALAARHLHGDGPFTKRCHELIVRRLAVRRALLTTSCTHALEMAAILLDIRPGDEVIVPSFTFVSTANAFVLRGARPVFVDSRPDTLNLDERTVEALITPRTRAIVPVHYAGVGCEMDALGAIAEAHGLAIVEDNAHGMFGKYRGRWLGTFGAMASQSFHDTKNFSCGEGGALLINREDLADRAEIVREKGTNRSRFFRGQVDRYTWVDVGSSYLPSDLLAAFLLAQLESEEAIQAHRQRIWERYQRDLAAWATRVGATQPVVPAHCEQSWHMYYVLLPTLDDRQDLIQHLRSRGIIAPFHYQPLHTSTMGERFGGVAGSLPVVESVADRLVRFPLFNDMSESDLDLVLQAIHEWR